MLFGYPATAIQANWLHDCICDGLVAIHAAIDSKATYPKWPTILPVAHQVTFKSRWGLRKRYEEYDTVARQLKSAERDRILQILLEENAIPQLLSGQKNCGRTSDLPAKIQEPVKSLFGFAFDLLTPFKVRDKQYKAIYEAANEHMCPFCGTEYFDAPGAKREALDHYLALNHYPFAAANMRNLVPMGYKCNSSYKLAADILMDSTGASRVAYDPYNHAGVTLELDKSNPYGGSKESIPSWVIEFFPAGPATKTWDETFSIVKRYKRDHLDPSFHSWLRLFGQWAKREKIAVNTNNALIAALRRYEENWREGGITDRAFLKAAVFKMLRKHCESGNQRLLTQLRELATYTNMTK